MYSSLLVARFRFIIKQPKLKQKPMYAYETGDPFVIKISTLLFSSLSHEIQKLSPPENDTFNQGDRAGDFSPESLYLSNATEISSNFKRKRRNLIFYDLRNDS